MTADVTKDPPPAHPYPSPKLQHASPPVSPPRPHPPPANRMLAATTNHLYYPSSQNHLGSGASCHVYLGVDKTTGQTHALKVLRDVKDAHSLEHVREVAALQALRHNHIVAFIGYEHELSDGRPVLVLEHCRGGSLLTLLQQPQNLNGLHDDEFRLLLDHMCSGMRYLRNRGFVHRDIKPGNILRDVAPDGRSVFKISDFGASRQPKENDECHSLAGTEEYLHPTIYHKAFLDDRFGHVTYRGDCADMWSLGCTLYHACTGSTPFLPHGGARHNRKIMFQMISKKPRGTIAGEQKEPGGNIVWRKDLPSSCNMSENLRGHVRPLIAGVLELEGQWTFETFDRQAGEVVRLTPHWLLVANTPSLDPVYTCSDVTLVEFQEVVAALTEIPASQQSLFFRDHRLSNSVPLTSPSDPLTLVNDAENESHLPKKTHTMEPLPTLHSGIEASVERDAHAALQSCAALYKLAGSVVRSGWMLQGLLSLTRALGLEIQADIKRLSRWLRTLQGVFNERKLRWEMLRDITASSLVLSGHVNSKPSHMTLRHSDARGLCNKLEQLLRQTQGILKQLAQSPLEATVSSSRKATGAVTSHVPSERAEQCLRLCERTKEIMTNMENRKSSRPLSHYAVLLHQNDRKELMEHCARAVAVWQEDWSVHLQGAFYVFCQHHRSFIEGQKTIRQIEKLMSSIRKGSDQLLDITQEISCFYGKEKAEFEARIKGAVRRIVEERSQESGILMKEAFAIRQRYTSVLAELPDLAVLPDT